MPNAMHTHLPCRVDGGLTGDGCCGAGLTACEGWAGTDGTDGCAWAGTEGDGNGCDAGGTADDPGDAGGSVISPLGKPYVNCQNRNKKEKNEVE